MKTPLIHHPLLFCIGLFFSNCGGNPIPLEESFIRQNDEMIVISPVFDEYMTFDLSPLIDSLKYVKLELTDESLIGQITKLEIFEDRIYIQDYNTASLFVFSIEGKYLFKIHQLGNGPGEYTSLDFFILDRGRQRIYLTDLMTYFIIEYDLDGNYISQKKIPFWIRGIIPVSDDTYFIYANYVNNSTQLLREFNLFYTDDAFNIIKGYFPYDSKLIGKAGGKFATPQQGNFYFFKDHFYFFDSYNEIVYKTGTEELTPHIRFDFKGLGFNPEFLEKDPNTLLEYMKYNPFYEVAHCGENEDYIFYAIAYSFDYWSGIYCKNTGTNILCRSFMDRDDFIDFNIRTVYDSWLISVKPIESFFSKRDDYAKNTYSGKFTPITQEFIKHIDVEDNPVLVFYKLTYSRN